MSSNVECPVCHISFASSVITAHVNSCLNDFEETIDQSPQNDKKRPRESDEKLYNPSKSTKLFDVFKPKPDASVKQHSKNNSLALSSWDEKINFGSLNDNVIDCNADVDINLKKKTVFSDETKDKDFNQSLYKKSKDVSNSFSDKQTAKTKQTSENSNTPLAAKMRPCSLEHFVGQSQAVKKNSMLFNILSLTENVPSIILWGPPGCGKTTLANIIGKNCKRHGKWKFVSLSAVSASVNDVKQLANVASNDQKVLSRKTVLFLDEIHRFNKLQQDTLLPHVENGTLTLIGATTENPSFHVNSALLSRCRVVVLEKLCVNDIKIILQRALTHLNISLKTSGDDALIEGSCTSETKNSAGDNSPSLIMENSALEILANYTDGDARSALNSLQLAWEGCLAQAKKENAQNLAATITVDLVKEALQRSHVSYDKTGEEHYNTVSAMIKSLRGSDADAALYWMVRMLEGGENPLFIARRLVIFASEDIGLADTMALTQAVSTHQACHILGMPECALNLTHCVLYLAQAPKSAGTIKSLTAARNAIRQHRGPLPPVPLHLRNSSSKLMDELGYAKGYKYPPNFQGQVEQDYLPACLKGTKLAHF